MYRFNKNDGDRSSVFRWNSFCATAFAKATRPSLVDELLRVSLFLLMYASRKAPSKTPPIASNSCLFGKASR